MGRTSWAGRRQKTARHPGAGKAKTIVAIDKDAAAPIFKVADYADAAKAD